MPTFNRARYLERCVRSILGQTYPRIECLVMDAASKDGSVDMLQRLAGEDPRLKFISEPDKGEVDATNKGMSLVTGEIMGVQASDDFYVPDAVAKAVEFLLAHPDCIGVSGDALYVDDQGAELGRGVITYRGHDDAGQDQAHPDAAVQELFRLSRLIFRLARSLAECMANSTRFLRDTRLGLLSAPPRRRRAHRLSAQNPVQIHRSPGHGSVRSHWAKVEAQRRQIHQRYGMKWHHELLRSTVGRFVSYLANPYRTPFIPGLKREIREAVARRFGR